MHQDEFRNSLASEGFLGKHAAARRQKTKCRLRELKLCLLVADTHKIQESSIAIPPALSDDTFWDVISSRVVVGSFAAEYSAQTSLLID